MKPILVICAALGLSACSTLTGTPGTTSATPKSPAQIAQQVCPPVQTTLTSLGALALDPAVSADLAIADTAVSTVCAVGSAVTTASLQSLAGNVLPVLVTAVRSSKLAASQQQSIITDLTVAQIVLTGALALNPPLTSIGTSVAIPVAAASAPK